MPPKPSPSLAKQPAQGTPSEAAPRGLPGRPAWGPEAFQAFLADFPKGADLHVHLSGAVYAESFIRAAGKDGLCVDPAALSSLIHPANLRCLERLTNLSAVTRPCTIAWSTPSPCAVCTH